MAILCFWSEKNNSHDPPISFIKPSISFGRSSLLILNSSRSHSTLIKKVPEIRSTNSSNVTILPRLLWRKADIFDIIPFLSWHFIFNTAVSIGERKLICFINLSTWLLSYKLFEDFINFFRSCFSFCFSHYYPKYEV